MSRRTFDTEVINLKSICESHFSIPTYQRPYVWGQMEIEKLIKDLNRSFESDPSEFYFIGTILTKEEGSIADLIDGQQRFTTLWLFAFVLKKKKIKTELLHFLESKERLRLNFEIRKEVESYLNQLIGRKTTDLEITDYEIENLP